MTMPTLPYSRLRSASEEAVERYVERLVDAADALLLGGKATQVEYDDWHRALNEWADGQYRLLGRIRTALA